MIRNFKGGRAVACVAATVLLISFAQPANASEHTATAKSVATSPASVTVGNNGGRDVAFDGASGQVTAVDAQSGVLSVDLPGVGTATAPVAELATAAKAQSPGRLLGTTSLPGAMVASYATARGFQALISIRESSASKRYEFPLVLPAGAAPALQRDGSVRILDARGALLGSFDRPWARDANAASVATSYRLEGSTLVQTVEHGTGSAYPIVADPNGIWGWIVCIGAVTVWAASNTLAALKVAQLVRRFGSIRRTIEIALRAFNAATKTNKFKAVVGALGAVGAELLGVEGIRQACFT
jgi:hypothetical protein